jgi:hypothetical protein
MLDRLYFDAAVTDRFFLSDRVRAHFHNRLRFSRPLREDRRTPPKFEFTIVRDCKFYRRLRHVCAARYETTLAP